MEPNPTLTTKKVALTLTLPELNFNALKEKIKNSASKFLASVYNPVRSFSENASDSNTASSRRMNFPRMRKPGFNKKYFKIIFPLILGLIVVGAIAGFIRSLPDAKSMPIADGNPSVVSDSLDTINLDRKFLFPLRDEKGKEVSNLEYVIQSASIQRQIIVQGQRASAVPGRVFLIFNLKITNNLKQTIQLNTRDYLRVVVPTNANEQLAPDIHNDPVEVQAISTKYTRVGIAVDEVALKRTVQLKVGEIDADKENIDLNFKF